MTAVLPKLKTGAIEPIVERAPLTPPCKLVSWGQRVDLVLNQGADRDA
jgi:hypothetical protein